MFHGKHRHHLQRLNIKPIDSTVQKSNDQQQNLESSLLPNVKEVEEAPMFFELPNGQFFNVEQLIENGMMVSSSYGSSEPIEALLLRSFVWYIQIRQKEVDLASLVI